MKCLVVFYSLDGNTRLLAEAIARAAGADRLELKPKGETRTTGLRKVLWGGRQVLTRACPELEPWSVKPESYDVLFLGTPVWAWSYTPALRAFFQSARLDGRSVALFCSHGGGKGGVFRKMREALPASCRVLGEADFREPLRFGAEQKAGLAAQWATRMLKAAKAAV